MHSAPPEYPLQDVLYKISGMAPNLLSIEGGRDVVGDVYISGSKNAGLPIMAASILALGPLLARFGHATISVPGGCTIGKRPIDEHIRGLEKLGACVTHTQTAIEARVPRTGLQGTILQLRTPTVTGTMNLILAACRVRGVTHIRNAAREPEVVDLCHCLISMGMAIQGVGTEHLEIYGRDIPLRPYNYRVMDDRIEGGTFLILGALAGNPLRIHGCREEHQTVLIEKLRTVGAQIHRDASHHHNNQSHQPQSHRYHNGTVPGSFYRSSTAAHDITVHLTGCQPNTGNGL